MSAAITPMTHVSEIGTENFSQTAQKLSMSCSLPETGARKIRFQTACQTHHTGNGFLVPVFDTDLW